MIRLISDFNHLVNNTDELVVSNVADYVSVYVRILQAYEKKENLAVYVQLPAVEHWFKQMAERYTEGTFVFERIDARIRLQQLWGIQIPETVEPEEIVEAGLLDLEITPNPNDRFEDFLLETFYDPLYAARDFPINKLVELLDAFEETRWKRNERLRLIYMTYLNRIDRGPDRSMPDVLWYQKEFLYTLSYQKQPAPLIFVIAGTGSSFYSSSMIFLQRVLWQAGFHVICLSSPTQMNFVTTASANCVPGNIREDTQDLYRVMTLAWEQVQGRIKVTDF